MPERVLTIPYPEELLLSLKENEAEFASQARLLLAVKLYELGKISTGMGARLAGMGRVEFMFSLKRFGLSPIGTEPNELAGDLARA
jgi:predicted HTH domain antitoxin